MRLERLCPFPVGAVLQMVTSDDPNDIYPGTDWRQMSGVFLYASDAEHVLGATGGAASHSHTTGGHVLTVDEIPSHTHSVGAHAHTVPAHGHGNNISFSVNSSGAVTNGITGGSHNHSTQGYDRVSAGVSGGSQVMHRTTISSDPTDNGMIKASTHTHNLPNHTHTLTKSGAVSDKAAFNTNNSTAFDSGSRGGGSPMPMATPGARRACPHGRRSTRGSASHEARGMRKAA